MLKKQVKEKGRPPYVGLEVHFPLQSLKIHETELPLFIEVCVFRMRCIQNKIFPAMHELKWAEMNWNESKWAQKSLSESK